MESIEKSAVEDYIIRKLEKEKNWIFKKARDLDRDNYQQPLLVNNLIEAIRRINTFELSENDMKKVLAELEYKTSGVQGVEEILNFLKKGIFMRLETREERYIHLIDYEDLDYNEFIISRQVIYRSATDEIRPDIVLYVNGIPLVIIECKSPTDPKTSWEDAYNDLQDALDVAREVQGALGRPILAGNLPIQARKPREPGKDRGGLVPGPLLPPVSDPDSGALTKRR